MPINRIKKWAKERGLSQTQVAALAGTQQGRVSEWYNGKIEPSLKSLQLLAKNAKCEISDLIERNQ